MDIEIKGAKYQIVMCSDTQRDGMYLEVLIPGTNPLQQVAEVFYSDQTHNYTVSCFQENLPLELVELLIREAKIRLPANID